MLLNSRLARRTVVGALGTGAVFSAMFPEKPSVTTTSTLPRES